MGVAPSRHNETGHAAALADNEATIRRESRPAFADALFLGALCPGEKGNKTFLKAVEHLPIGCDLWRTAGHSVIARVSIKGFGLPPTEKQTLISHAPIKRQLRNSEARQLRHEAGHWDSHEIFVTHWDDGQF